MEMEDGGGRLGFKHENLGLTPNSNHQRQISPIAGGRREQEHSMHQQ